MRIRACASWRAYVRTTSGWVDSPVIFLLTSYASLAFSILFAWHMLARTGPFWNNINNVLFFGWIGLLLSILTLTQIKWVNRAIGLPVMGIFLLALSTYIYGDARAVTAQRLNRHFSFSTSQLTEAIDVGGRIGFAIEIAGIGSTTDATSLLVDQCACIACKAPACGGRRPTTSAAPSSRTYLNAPRRRENAGRMGSQANRWHVIRRPTRGQDDQSRGRQDNNPTHVAIQYFSQRTRETDRHGDL